MENLKAIAITHHQFEVEEVGRFHIEEGEQPQRLAAIRKEFGFDELMLLSTCNRVEFFVCTPQELTPEFLNRFLSSLYPTLSSGFLSQVVEKIKVYERSAAVEHLFKVASSMDSLVVGEREIITQVRKAYDRCKAAGLTGDALRLLIQKTIETAKKVFTETAIAERPVSVVSLAYKRLKQLQLPANTRFIIIGAGQTMRNMMRFLAKDGFTRFAYFNRTEENIRQLTDITDGEVFSLEKLSQYTAGFDVLISCTGSTEPIINSTIYASLLAGEMNKKTIVDLALPNDVSHEVMENNRGNAINIKELKEIAAENLREREKEMENCNEIISESTIEFELAYKERQLEIAMKEIPGKVKEIRSTATETVFKKELSGLDAPSQEVLHKVLDYFEKKYISMPIKMAKEVMLKK